jgi:hypothetical protein
MRPLRSKYAVAPQTVPLHQSYLFCGCFAGCASSARHVALLSPRRLPFRSDIPARLNGKCHTARAPSAGLFRPRRLGQRPRYPTLVLRERDCRCSVRLAQTRPRRDQVQDAPRDQAKTLAASANTHCDRAIGITSLSERSTIANPDAVLTGMSLWKSR